jgi:hypothetical protein
MRASLFESWGRRTAAKLLILGAAAFTVVGCSSGGGSPGATGTAGTSGAAGAAGSGAGATGTAGAAAGASGATGAAGGTAGAAGTNAGTAGAAAGATGTAGAGAAAGSTGTAGATPDAGTDAGAATLVLPVMRAGGVYTLEFGNTKLTVDPMPGGRVVEYSLDGTNILTTATVNPLYWGSTLWTAPEDEWMALGNMYLVPGFDTLPFAVTVAADNSFTAIGQNATFNDKTLSLTKKFAANLAAGAIDITYSITDQGTTSFAVGHWEVTRLYPNGLTFFPAPPAASKPPIVANPDVMKVDKLIGMIWFDHSKFDPGPAPGKYGKYSTDASGGWVAHVVPDTSGKGDLLLVKTFKDIPDGRAGTGHGEVEIYAREDRSYEEVEDHHEQANFMPTVKIDWPVRWYLRRLPPSVARTAGNQQLVDYVTNLIK